MASITAAPGSPLSPSLVRVCRVVVCLYLAVLQWARANGCPWNEHTCENAEGSGHLAVLQWARANGCPRRGCHLCERCVKSVTKYIATPYIFHIYPLFFCINTVNHA